MYDHILIPTDGSIETEQAVSDGLGLARTYDATVHALYVTDESEFSPVTDASAHEQLRSSAEKLGRRATTHIAETAAEFDLTVGTNSGRERPTRRYSTTSTNRTSTSWRWERTVGPESDRTSAVRRSESFETPTCPC